MNIIEACNDPLLFRPWFRDPETWTAWRAFLAALFGLPLDDDALNIYRQCTGRTKPPTSGAGEAWLICGRRGGKSFMLALVAVYLAAFKDWTPYLQRGERATVAVIAADRKQARVIFRYIVGLLEGVPMLANLIERQTTETIDLAGQVSVEVHTTSFRTTRGYSLCCLLADELAFWRSDDSANPDTEILAALRPAMASIPGSMLLAASSPYAKRGQLYETFKRHYGKDGPLLVWRAPTSTMNPTIPGHVIEAAYEADPARAMAEYGAEFRTDIESFVSRETIEACTVPGRHQLPPMSGTHYRAFVDPSGGSRDSFTLAIAHRDGEMAVLDVLVERKPPFSPEAVAREFADLLKLYRVSTVTGDRYAGEWPREQFRKRGISYELSALPKSGLYQNLLPILNAGTAELLDVPIIANQLAALERRTSRAGKDSIDHSPGAHDDCANAVAGVLGLAAAPVFQRRMLQIVG